MNQLNQKLIDAIVAKAEKYCPGSLALIGVYGSAATGDTHAKSDLDLLILVQDDQAGSVLSAAFILDDAEIGYDLYCTTWGMLEDDAECNHAYLAKLMDSPLVYVADKTAPARLEALRKKARALLASDARYEKAQASFGTAKALLAECFLTDSLSHIRATAGGVIHYVLNAVMLYHGQYFHRGTKRTFAELAALPLPFPMEALVMPVIRGETAGDIRCALTNLLKTVQAHLVFPSEKSAPCPANLAGTYEEMYSNWRNKVFEAAEQNDLFSTFMSFTSFQFMLNGIAGGVALPENDAFAAFDPNDAQKNIAAFETALQQHLQAYRMAGIAPRCFSDADAFEAEYLQ